MQHTFGIFLSFSPFLFISCTSFKVVNNFWNCEHFLTHEYLLEFMNIVFIPWRFFTNSRTLLNPNLFQFVRFIYKFVNIFTNCEKLNQRAFLKNNDKFFYFTNIFLKSWNFWICEHFFKIINFLILKYFMISEYSSKSWNIFWIH